MPITNDTTFSQSQFKGSGEALYYEISAGVSAATGIDLGYIETFTLDGPKIDVSDRLSKRRLDYGSKVISVPGTKSQEGKITLTDFTIDNIKLALFGAVTAVNIASGTAVDEEVVVKTGQYTQLAHKLVSAVTVESLATGGTTYDAVTDYEIDGEMGFIRIPEGSTIPDGGPVFVSYTYAAETGTSIQADVTKIKEAMLIFKGRDITRDNRLFLITIHRANITLSGGLDILSKDLATLELKLDILANSAGKTITYVEIKG